MVTTVIRAIFRQVYECCVSQQWVTVSQDISHAKLPTKIKVFMWYLKNGIILTKDNLVGRNWHGYKSCAYCQVPESIQHLFFSCTHAKFLYGVQFM